MTSRRGSFNWLNFTILTTTPVTAIVWLTLYFVVQRGVWASDILSLVVMYLLTGLAITAGYHRYYAHRTFECRWIVRLYFMLFGAAALQNSAYHWVSDHRNHHRYTDREHDPYNIQKGFLWAHIGWIFFNDPPGRGYENVRDLDQDRLVLWQKRYYVLIAIVTGFGLPFLVGLAFGRPWSGLLWGGFIRLVLGHHCTFLINSAAHFFGKRPYMANISARDSWWLAFFSYGEGYHNFHHAFPRDYRNGVAFYHWDPTKWLIRGLSWVRLTSALRRTPTAVLRLKRARQAS